jgi:acetyl-CoA acyltransferase
MRHLVNACIVGALRTPIGKYGGVLRDVRPDDLSAMVMRRIVAASGLPANSIDDILWGCANQAGEDNRNVGRMGALLAGLPYSVPASTVNRLCGSSMDTVIHGTRAIWSGDAECILAGGVESMSGHPIPFPKPLRCRSAISPHMTLHSGGDIPTPDWRSCSLWKAWEKRPRMSQRNTS